VVFELSVGPSYYVFDAKCIDRGGAVFRHVCRAGGYYALLDGGSDGDPGFAVWYNDPEKALEELGAWPGEFSEAFGVTLRLCINEASGIAVLADDRVEGRVYVFPYFDWRLRYVKGPAFITTHSLLKALVGYFGNGENALTALALVRLCLSAWGRSGHLPRPTSKASSAGGGTPR